MSIDSSPVHVPQAALDDFYRQLSLAPRSDASAQREVLSSFLSYLNTSPPLTLSMFSAFKRAGGVSLITRLLHSDSEEVVDLASSLLSNLSGPSSRAPATRSITFSPPPVISSCSSASTVCFPASLTVTWRELPFLKVGTAYNAWTSSLLLGKYLWLCSSNSAPFSDLPILPISISSRSILELGCGVGVVGFTAAKLGGHVTMSDFNDDVLRNVAEALQLNELTCGVGGVEVAKLDWGCEGGESEGCTSKQRWYGGEDDACVGDRDCAAFAPLKPDVQFDIVLAADCCYEPDHPRLLCSVLKHRLRVGGFAVFAMAVRYPKLHSELLEGLQLICSDVTCCTVDSEQGLLQVPASMEGASQHSQYYEHGMRIVIGKRK